MKTTYAILGAVFLFIPFQAYAGGSVNIYPSDYFKNTMIQKPLVDGLMVRKYRNPSPLYRFPTRFIEFDKLTKEVSAGPKAVRNFFKTDEGKSFSDVYLDDVFHSKLQSGEYGIMTIINPNANGGPYIFYLFGKPPVQIKSPDFVIGVPILMM